MANNDKCEFGFRDVLGIDKEKESSQSSLNKTGLLCSCFRLPNTKSAA